MASIGHIAVGVAAGRAWARSGRAGKAMLGLSVLSMLPDVDVVGMAMGVPYEAPWGHRGATHSLAMAALVGVVVALVARRRGWRGVALALVCFAVMASHGLLDAMTDGGRGVALLWPFSTERIFFPWRPIPVAPIGVDIVSWRGLEVVARETLFFLPLLLFAAWPRRSSS